MYQSNRTRETLHCALLSETPVETGYDVDSRNKRRNFGSWQIAYGKQPAVTGTFTTSEKCATIIQLTKTNRNRIQTMSLDRIDTLRDADCRCSTKNYKPSRHINSCLNSSRILDRKARLRKIENWFEQEKRLWSSQRFNTMNFESTTEKEKNDECSHRSRQPLQHYRSFEITNRTQTENNKQNRRRSEILNRTKDTQKKYLCSSHHERRIIKDTQTKRLCNSHHERRTKDSSSLDDFFFNDKYNDRHHHRNDSQDHSPKKKGKKIQRTDRLGQVTKKKRQTRSLSKKRASGENLILSHKPFSSSPCHDDHNKQRGGHGSQFWKQIDEQKGKYDLCKEHHRKTSSDKRRKSNEVQTPVYPSYETRTHHGSLVLGKALECVGDDDFIAVNRNDRLIKEFSVREGRNILSEKQQKLTIQRDSKPEHIEDVKSTQQLAIKRIQVDEHKYQISRICPRLYDSKKDDDKLLKMFMKFKEPKNYSLLLQNSDSMTITTQLSSSNPAHEEQQHPIVAEESILDSTTNCDVGHPERNSWVSVDQKVSDAIADFGFEEPIWF